jgi:hypothetical protein
MREYVIRLRAVADGYQATVREISPSQPRDGRSVPGTLPGVGTARTVPAAILQAVVNARVALIPTDPYAQEA